MNVISKTNLFLLFICCTAHGLGQSPVGPVPRNVKVETQLESPVTVSLKGVEDISRSKSPVHFSIQNQSDQSIRAIVISGIPGTVHVVSFYGTPLRPSTTDEKISGNAKWKHGAGSWTVSVDFVLFNDGTSWGPDRMDQASYVTGVFDGNKASYTDARLHAANGDKAVVSAWLKAEPTLPHNSPKTANQQKWEKGFLEGYRQKLFALSQDFQRMGLTGIRLRMETMEKDLGLDALQSVGTTYSK